MKIIFLSSCRIGFAVFVCFLSIPAFLSAQVSAENHQHQSTAMEIETLLNTRAVTYAQASRFVLEAANVLAADNPIDAFNYAVQQSWLPGNVSPDGQARLNHISRLLMGSFNMSGGIMYSITKNSHYAYRELVYLNIIQTRSAPSMYISGERLLFYVSRILTSYDTRTAAEPVRLVQPVPVPEPEPVVIEEDVMIRRETLAAEIASIIEEQAIADTTVEATEEGVMITLSNIMFPADSAVLPDSEKDKLTEIGRVLGSISGIKILIAGHTTNVGSQEYLLILSRDRAKSVADYLVSIGASEADNVIIEGYGGSRPVAGNDTPEGMAANRRVEIIILEN
ncbi:MAG: OmpA family protein [Treponema sp.]|nr:OmpA family protein [Treponema sp.]